MPAMQPDWMTLNAYVDGELSASEAATVARALADDRALAQTVATLTSLKAAVHDGVEPVEIDLPARQRRIWRPVALAASLAALLVIGIFLLSPWQGGNGTAVLAQAWQIHDSWAQTVEPPAAAASGGVVLAGLNYIGPKAYLPDLTSARLTLTRLETVILPGTVDALHAGYRGTRGCRVSLLIVQGGADLPKELTIQDKGSRRGYAWRSGTHGYLLLADGMDPARLGLIAETVQRASLENSPFGPETRTALSESRARSIPCQA